MTGGSGDSGMGRIAGVGTTATAVAVGSGARMSVIRVAAGRADGVTDGGVEG